MEGVCKWRFNCFIKMPQVRRSYPQGYKGQSQQISYSKLTSEKVYIENASFPTLLVFQIGETWLDPHNQMHFRNIVGGGGGVLEKRRLIKQLSSQCRVNQKCNRGLVWLKLTKSKLFFTQTNCFQYTFHTNNTLHTMYIVDNVSKFFSMHLQVVWLAWQTWMCFSASQLCWLLQDLVYVKSQECPCLSFFCNRSKVLQEGN